MRLLEAWQSHTNCHSWKTSNVQSVFVASSGVGVDDRGDDRLGELRICASGFEIPDRGVGVDHDGHRPSLPVRRMEA